MYAEYKRKLDLMDWYILLNVFLAFVALDIFVYSIRSNTVESVSVTLTPSSEVITDADALASKKRIDNALLESEAVLRELQALTDEKEIDVDEEGEN